MNDNKSGKIKNGTSLEANIAAQNAVPFLKLKRPDPVRSETLELRRSSREILKSYCDFLSAHEEGKVTLDMVAEELVESSLGRKLKIVLPDPIEKESIALRESAWKKMEDFATAYPKEMGQALTPAAIMDSLCANLAQDKLFQAWKSERNDPKTGTTANEPNLN